MLPDWKRIVPEALYSVMAARRLLGISHTTIYDDKKHSFWFNPQALGDLLKNKG